MSTELPPARGRKLTRSNNKLISGVCAGLAEYFGLDVTLVRVLYVIVSLLSAAFPGIIVYVVLMFVMPPAGSSA